MKGVDSRWQEEGKSPAEDIEQAQQEQEQKGDALCSVYPGGTKWGVVLVEGQCWLFQKDGTGRQTTGIPPSLYPVSQQGLY